MKKMGKMKKMRGSLGFNWSKKKRRNEDEMKTKLNRQILSLFHFPLKNWIKCAKEAFVVYGTRLGVSFPSVISSNVFVSQLRKRKKRKENKKERKFERKTQKVKTWLHLANEPGRVKAKRSQYSIRFFFFWFDYVSQSRPWNSQLKCCFFSVKTKWPKS